MTVTHSWIGGAILTAIVAVVLDAAGVPLETYPEWALVAGATVTLAVGTCAWMYSPLPNSNGGIAESDPLRGRYWGFHPKSADGRTPTHVYPHETEERAIYRFSGGEYLAMDANSGVRAWGDTPDEADDNLRAQLK